MSDSEEKEEKGEGVRVGFCFKSDGKETERKWASTVQNEGCMRVHIALPSIGVEKEIQSKLMNKLMKLDLSLNRHHGVSVILSASGDRDIADVVMGSNTTNSLLTHAEDAHVFIAIPGNTFVEDVVDKDDLSHSHGWVALHDGEDTHSLVELQCKAQRLHGKKTCVAGVLASTQDIKICKKTRKLTEAWNCEAIASERCIAFQGIYDGTNEKSIDDVFAAFIKQLVRTVGKPSHSRIISDTASSKGQPLPLPAMWEEVKKHIDEHKITFVPGYGSQRLLFQLRTKLMQNTSVLYHDFGVSASHTHLRTALMSLLNQLVPQAPPLSVVTQSEQKLLASVLKAIEAKANKDTQSQVVIVFNNIDRIVDNGPLSYVDDTLPSLFEWTNWRRLPDNVRFVFGCESVSTARVGVFVDKTLKEEKAAVFPLDDMKKGIVEHTFSQLLFTLPRRLEAIAKSIEEKLWSSAVDVATAEKVVEVLMLDAEVEDTEFQSILTHLDDNTAMPALFAHTWGVFHNAAELLQDTIGNNFLQRALQLIAATETGLGLFDVIRLFRLSNVEPIYITCVAHILGPFTRLVKGRFCFDLGTFSSFVLKHLGNGNAEGIAISQLLLNQWRSGKKANYPTIRIVLERPHIALFEFQAKKKVLELFNEKEYRDIAFPERELSLEHASFATTDIKTLSTVIEQQTNSFKSIRLFNDSLDKQCIQSLVMALSSKNLTQLNLSFNPLGDSGIKVLFSFISSSAVARLFIRNVGLSAEGVEHIVNNIPSSPSLHHLNVGKNAIGVRGCNELCDCLSDNKTLQTLGLCATELTDGAVEGIIALLKKNTAIIIDVRENAFSDAAVALF
eukprot:m.136139 g.136139  ORF g.136139 m.136139 type:complete len:842 (+) comp13131_c0_seq2:71-2596(+)